MQFYYLFLELFGGSRGNEILELLNFPDGPLRPANASMDVVAYRYSERKRRRKTDVAGIGDLCGEGAEAVDIEYKFTVPHLIGELEIVEIESGLVVSAANSLWPETSKWPRPIPYKWSEEHRSAEAREQFQVQEQWPNELSCRLGIHSDGVLPGEFLAESLIESIPGRWIGTDIFGAAGWARDDGRGNAASAMPNWEWPLRKGGFWRLKLIQQRFLRLEQVLIGSPELCRGSAAALGDPVRVFERHGEAGSTGLVYIPDKFLEDDDSKVRAAAFLMPEKDPALIENADSGQITRGKQGHVTI